MMRMLLLVISCLFLRATFAQELVEANVVEPEPVLQSCPPGYTLSQDGRHCGIECYTCNGVSDHESCNQTTVCAPWATSCYAEVRRRDGVIKISKGCQQDQACIRNMRHNTQIIETGAQQCNEDQVHSVCMCCCFDTKCNEGLCPYETDVRGCDKFEVEHATYIGLQANDEIMPFGEVILSCPSGFVAAETGLTSLECGYDYQFRSYHWNGNPEDFGTCIDIDECLTDNGGCGGGAICLNNDGGYECVCPNDYDDYILVDGKICDRDECSDEDKGGCDYYCENTVGSYICSCPVDDGLVLAIDGKSCVMDECIGSSCVETCENSVDGPTCGCFTDGYEIDGEGGTSCIDIDECRAGTSGCEQRCTNTEGGYECFCEDGFELNQDLKTCRINLCLIENGGCEQMCTRFNDTQVTCSCFPGFRLNENKTECEDINECLETAGICEHDCVNTDGGYECDCPPGQVLRNDKRTCGTACYSCNGATSNEECNSGPMEVCIVDYESCENVVRVHNGVKMISKGCKQTSACLNSYRKVPINPWEASHCVPGSMNDVCACCCKGHMCNFYERPCMPQNICELPKANVVLVLSVTRSTELNDFQRLKAFAKGIAQSYNIGEDGVRTAIVTYSKVPEDVRYFDQNNAQGSVLLALDRVRQDGTGTNTAVALNWVLNEVLHEKNGWDDSVSTIVITVIDGKSKDITAAGDVSASIREERGAMTYAIGVGDVDTDEVQAVAGDESRTFVFASHQDLSEDALATVSSAVCYDADECATDNGGCSDTCTNTPGSYACSCPEDKVLSGDQHTCTDDISDAQELNECLVNNGGCAQECIDLPIGHDCRCYPGYEDVGGYCYNINECEEERCQYTDLCVDTAGGFFCRCPSGMVRTSNKTSCVPATARYDCPPGFQPLGHSCIMQSEAVSFVGAESACGEMGARVMVVTDEGVRTLLKRRYVQAWIVSDMEVDENETCTYIGHFKDGVYSNCELTLPAYCEIVRETGLMFFSHEWPSGAQGTLMLPTGVNEVTVTFPHPVQRVNAWNCKVQSPESGLTWIISQDDHERQSGDCGFVINNMAIRFPDYDVVITANTPATDIGL